MSLRKSFIFLLACLTFAAAGEAAAGTTFKCFTACKAIASGAAQPSHRVADPRTLDSPAAGGWRLVRIRNPRGGPDTFSIMHSADVSRSDLAGLVLHCQTAPDVDTIVMVIEPWPPASHPKVTLHIGARNAQFDATVLEPFTALLLPRGATAFLTESWRTDPFVSVSIEGGNKVMNGTVPIGGLGLAFDDLLKSCPLP
jgi:hypothetical protein